MVFLLQPALMELYKNVLQSVGEKENKTGPVQIIQDNVKSHREMSVRIFLSAVILKQSFTILPIKKNQCYLHTDSWIRFEYGLQ